MSELLEDDELLMQYSYMIVATDTCLQFPTPTSCTQAHIQVIFSRIYVSGWLANGGAAAWLWACCPSHQILYHKLLIRDESITHLNILSHAPHFSFQSFLSSPSLCVHTIPVACLGQTGAHMVKCLNNIEIIVAMDWYLSSIPCQIKNMRRQVSYWLLHVWLITRFTLFFLSSFTFSGSRMR